jgi:hypothetical protein
MAAIYAKRILLNLLLALVVVIPIWRIGLYLITLAAGAARDPHESVDFAFYFVILAPQMLLGSFLQQVLLVLVLPRLPTRTWRSIAVMSTAILPLTLVLLRRGDPGLLWTLSVLVPLAVGLVTYGLLLRLPPEPGEFRSNQPRTSTAS